MARPQRIQPAGAIFHLWARGNRRSPIFLDQTDRERFLALLFEVARRYGWTIHGYCLMGNHYHLLVEIADEGTLSPGMQRLNGLYAQHFNRRHNLDGHLFQGRFKSKLVQDDQQLLTLDHYILHNPVRALLCSTPADWPWTPPRARPQPPHPGPIRKQPRESAPRLPRIPHDPARARRPLTPFGPPPA